MLGAIIGDIIGSVYEMPKDNIKTKDFPLWSTRSQVTDDSVLTCAVASAFLMYLKQPRIVNLHKTLINELKLFGNSHQFVPYGKRFRQWMEDYLDNEPYNSFSDGAPMRVSSVAWLFDTIEEVEAMAKVSAEVTHNHPEGIKGAQAIAIAIFLARTTKSKEKIKEYIEENYYPLNFTLEEIRPKYFGSLECKKTVPQAIVAFLDANDFEDAIRNAISIGGDSDTLAAMTGSVAEAFYGISESIEFEGKKRMPSDLQIVYHQFEDYVEKHKKKLSAKNKKM